MKLEPADIEGLMPLIEMVVDQVLRKRDQADAKLTKLSYSEAEAAGLLGVRQHVLADARRRGEIKGGLVGRRMHYSRKELVKFSESLGS